MLTDSQGNYRFDDLAPGNVSLAVLYTSLDRSSVPLTLAAGTVNRRNIGLTSQIYAMDKLVVAGEREGNAQAVTLQRLSDGVKNIVSTIFRDPVRVSPPGRNDAVKARELA